MTQPNKYIGYYISVVVHVYRFNQVFDKSTKQEEIFENVAHGVIDKYIIILFTYSLVRVHTSFSTHSPYSCLEGYNGTIFAYGQVKCSPFLSRD